jgi:hypothetical protein
MGLNGIPEPSNGLQKQTVKNKTGPDFSGPIG